MNPVLHFIDWLIRQHGQVVSGVFVYIGLPLTAWLSGADGHSNQATRTATRLNEQTVARATIDPLAPVI